MRVESVQCIRVYRLSDKGKFKANNTAFLPIYPYDLIRSLKFMNFNIFCVCLFVCLEVWRFSVPLENFSLIWRRHHTWWRALCSALMVIEQCGFFNVQHRLWHGTTFLKVISEDPWPLTPVAECGAVITGVTVPFIA